MPVIPAVGMDPFSFEAGDRPSCRRTRAPKKRDFVGEAYDWVRMNVDFQDTLFLGPISTEKHDIRHFPKWIADRVVAMLVRDGVLRGPVFLPKEKDGEPIWYSVRAASRDWHVAWVNGAWRESFHNDYRPIHYHALGPKREARWKNRKARVDAAVARAEEKKKREYEARGEPVPFHLKKSRSRFRTLEVPVPASSATALTKEYLRRLPAIPWDGTAYVPVRGPAMEAMFEWRRARVKEMNSRSFSERTECPKCRTSFPVSRKNLRSLHRPDQCRVMLVTRIMET